MKKWFSQEIFEPIFNEKYHWKIRSRFQLLISQIQIELEMDIPDTLKKQIKIEFASSDHLKIFENVGAYLTKQGIVRKSVLECPISTLCIPGITINSRKRYSIIKS